MNMLNMLKYLLHLELLKLSTEIFSMQMKLDAKLIYKLIQVT